MTNETPAADGKMRAARYYGRGDIRVERVPVPELKPGTVAIDVAYSGICGSDLHEVRPPAPLWRALTRSTLTGRSSAPCTRTRSAASRFP